VEGSTAGRRRTRGLFLGAAVAGLLACGALAWAPPAGATTIVRGGDGNLLIGGDDRPEWFFLSTSSSTQWRVELIFPALIGSDEHSTVGCTQESSNPITNRFVYGCPRAAGRRIIAGLGGGDDIVEPRSPGLSDRLEADGAQGEDEIEGGRANDLLRGGGGVDWLRGDSPGAPGSDDELFGGPGNDLLIGGLGKDTLAGGASDDVLRGDDPDQDFVDADRLDGGTGVDRVRYTDRHLALTITLDGAANDGQHGGAEGDNLIGVENVTGGSGEDRITGNGSGNTFDGLGGRDFLFGLGSDDRLGGGPGNDLLHGDDGDDRLEGSTGNDNIFGDSGEDILIGGAGIDIFNGGAQDDRIFARDGRAENVNCGAGGGDFAQVDFEDSVRNCERRVRG